MGELHVWKECDYDRPCFWDCFFPYFSEGNYRRIWCVFDDNELLTRPWDEGFAKLERNIIDVRDGKIENVEWDGDYYVASITKDSVFFHTCFPEEDEYGYKLGIEDSLELIRECREVNYDDNETRAFKRQKEEWVKVVVAGFNEQGEIHQDYVFPKPLVISKDDFIVGQNLDLKDALYLKMGETRKLRHNPFGNYVPWYVKDVDLSELPKDLDLKAGMTVGLAVPGEGNTIGKVLEVNGKTAKVDFNHPRAGELVYCTVTRIG